MRVLAIETSTMTASVALVGGSRDLLLDADAGSRSDDLLPVIDRALTEAGLTLAELDAIAVGVGPGSFTGLRIGMATAKGLAFAAGLPLWTVSSLAALAFDAAGHIHEDHPLVVSVLDARRNEVFAGFFVLEPDRAVAIAPEVVIPVVALADAIRQAQRAGGPATALLVGDALVAHPEAIAAAGRPLSAARTTPSALSIARIARAHPGPDVLRAGTPVYIRPSEAEVKFPAGNPGGPFTLDRPEKK
jgi:tRNA threonylcarbamoyladenosine biosynthesis protein TsaB